MRRKPTSSLPRFVPLIPSFLAPALAPAPVPPVSFPVPAPPALCDLDELAAEALAADACA
jgi:hypothetical protein